MRNCVHAEGQLFLRILLQFFSLWECLGNHFTLLNAFRLIIASSNDSWNWEKIVNIKTFFTYYNLQNITYYKYIYLYVFCYIPEPGTFPDKDCGLRPNPRAHCNACAEHWEKVDLLNQKTWPVLDGTLWDWLVGLVSYGDISLTSVLKTTFVTWQH